MTSRQQAGEVAASTASIDLDVLAARSSSDGDALLEELCTRRLDHSPFPHVYVDVAYAKDRVDGRVVFQAIVAITGMRPDGAIEILGIDVGDSEDPAFWQRCLVTLTVRGLHGVEVVTSDDHRGIDTAVLEVFPGAAWVWSSLTGESGTAHLPRTPLRV